MVSSENGDAGLNESWIAGSRAHIKVDRSDRVEGSLTSTGIATDENLNVSARFRMYSI
jgi:hypothetical protein